jgi:hypothetical protein
MNISAFGLEFIIPLMAVFWVVLIALIMEAARTSETLINFYQTTRSYIQKTAIFVLNAVKTSNPTIIHLFSYVTSGRNLSSGARVISYPTSR